MKRVLSVILILIMVLSSFSACANKGDSESTGDNGSDKTVKPDETTEKQFQSFDELEFKSNKRFKNEDILRFNHKSGTFLAEKGTMTCISENGSGFVAPLNASSVVPYEELVAGCGASYGQSIDDVCSRYSLDKGYAAFAGEDASIKMFESSETLDVTARGGCVYVGYALDPNGEWAFMDFEMLKSVMLNQLVIQDAQGEYVVSVLMITYNSQRNVSMITQLYGPLNHVMQLISVVSKA